eukprot:365511-Chlamydomonas_euryale.AAC.10
MQACLSTGRAPRGRQAWVASAGRELRAGRQGRLGADKQARTSAARELRAGRKGHLGADRQACPSASYAKRTC